MMRIHLALKPGWRWAHAMLSIVPAGFAFVFFTDHDAFAHSPLWAVMARHGSEESWGIICSAVSALGMATAPIANRQLRIIGSGALGILHGLVAMFFLEVAIERPNFTVAQGACVTYGVIATISMLLCIFLMIEEFVIQQDLRTPVHGRG